MLGKDGLQLSDAVGVACAHGPALKFGDDVLLQKCLRTSGVSLNRCDRSVSKVNCDRLFRFPLQTFSHRPCYNQPMNRPYVICHMCTSIDGKILGKRWGKLPGPKNSANLFETTASSFNIPAWIVGNTTMKEFAGKPRALKRAARPVPAGDFIAAGNARSFAIGVDAKAVLRFDESESDGDHIVLLVTERASAAYLSHLREAGVSYLICGQKTVDLPLAMQKLHRDLKIKKLMLEGGGKFNGSMLRAGLVDEISQVIVPVVDGGMGISSFFDIPGPAPTSAAAHLRMMSHRMLPNGVQWLRYRVLRRNTPS